MRSVLLPATVFALAIGCPLETIAQNPVPLPAYNVDPSQVSVSGFESGSSMAMQLGIAYSSRIMGIGAFVGHPYDCLRPGNLSNANCRYLNTPDILGLQANMNRWSGQEIDAVANIARQRIYVYAGANDFVTGPTVVGQTVKLYEAFATSGNIRHEVIAAGHTFPTDFDNPDSVGTTCQSGGVITPPLANCHFDGAHATLEWLYGPLKPRNDGTPTGSLLLVDQGAFVARDRGMDEVAWLYVPTSCQSGQGCRLHVFLHDCGQSYFNRGDAWFANYSGHSRWADTNSIVLLFPQTRPDTASPRGCWDTEGLYDLAYDQKAGTQTTALMAMVARITSGYRAAATMRAIEFRHAEWDHYFVTTKPDEIVKLDTGVFAGWVRSGEEFGVYPLDTAGTSNVCRFFSTSFAPRSSHFYTPRADECAAVKENPNWEFEGPVFAVTLPDAAGGCQTGTQPLYRLYNDGKGAAPNHRYTTSASTRSAMIGQGWIPEGVGPLGVIACVPV